MPRSQRLSLLARLLAQGRYGSQQELARALRREGAQVTQATLSRDLRSLGVAKRTGPDGRPVYELPGPATETLDRERQFLDLRVFVNEVRAARNLLVILTPPGHANAVGRAVDLLGANGWVGSVAGDDTLLVVMESDAAAKRFQKRLEAIRSGNQGSGK